MADTRHTPPGTNPDHLHEHVHPADWSASDALLEKLIEQEERAIRRDRIFLGAAFGLIGLVIAALVMSVLALNRDIDAVAKATPKDNSVSTSTIKPGAVTGDKLAPGAVTADILAPGSVTAEALRDQAVTAAKLARGAVTAAAIAPGAVLNGAIASGAVGTGKLADGAVTGQKVGRNTLTGQNIREGTLGTVPRAATAQNALALGGTGAAAFVSGVQLVEVASVSSQQGYKGPVVATCPSGTKILAGGAIVEGASAVAVTSSGPAGSTSWSASAAAFAPTVDDWRLVVTAICAVRK